MIQAPILAIALASTEYQCQISGQTCGIEMRFQRHRQVFREANAHKTTRGQRLAGLHQRGRRGSTDHLGVPFDSAVCSAGAWWRCQRVHFFAPGWAKLALLDLKKTI